MTPPERTSGRGQAVRVFIACCVAFAIANVTWWMQPLLIDQLAILQLYTLPQIGALITLEMIGIALASMLSAQFAAGRRFLLLGVGSALGASAAVIASVMVTDFIGLLALRSLTGLCEGVCLMVANVAITQLGDADKQFARLNVINIAIGFVLVAVLPFVTLQAAQPPALILTALALIVLTPFMALMPSDVRVPGSAAEIAEVRAGANLRVLLIAGAAFVVAIASGIMWASYGLIGRSIGLSEAAVNAATATAVLASFIGGGLAAVLAGRVSRRASVIAGMMLISAAIAALNFAPTRMSFAIATSANVAAMVFVCPYLFAAAAERHPSGKGAAFASGAFFIGGAIAPLIGTLLAAQQSPALTGAVALLACAFVVVLYLAGDRRAPQR